MTDRTITLSRELADQIEIALGQVGKQDHLVDYALVAMTLRELRAALADQYDYLKSCEAAHNALAEPVPPAGGSPVPEYFVAACEEALRFYAEGKHFDVVDGRTRILCTGAIASHALKGIGGEYADMKGMEPAGVDVEVLARLDRHAEGGVTFSEGVLSYAMHGTELVDRTHVTRLQAEVEQHKQQAEYNQETALRWLAEKDALQSELTKARELLRMVSDKGLLGYMKYDVDDFLSDQSAPADTTDCQGEL